MWNKSNAHTWGCKVSKCPHRIFCDIEDLPLQIEEGKKNHSCHPKPSRKQINLLEIKQLLKSKLLEDPSQPFRRLINISLRQVMMKNETSYEALNDEDMKHLSQLLERIKKKYYGGSRPKDIASLKLYLDELKAKKPELTVTSRGENFIHVKNDLIILTTAQNMKELCNCKLLLGDGTFKYCPNNFKQMYTIHGYRGNHFFPAAYIFINNKSEEIYKEVFSALNHLAVDLCSVELCPEKFVLDFELAAINSIKDTFPTAEVKACRFHLLQSWFKRIKNDRVLRSHYEEQTELGKWLKGHLGLPFLPPEMIPKAWKELTESRPHQVSPQCDKFSDYILTNYVEKGADQHFKPSLFTPSLWAGEPCDPRLTGEREIRTSNACESFHRYFNEVFFKTHPNFVTVLFELLLIQEKTYTILQTINEPSSNIHTYSYNKNIELAVDVSAKYQKLKNSMQTRNDILDYLYDAASRMTLYKESKEK